MRDARQPNAFDPTRAQGAYQCPRCYRSKTEVLTATELFCYDCRNVTTWQEQGHWFWHNGRWHKALTLEEL
jgi:hypothetical protein